MRLNHIRIIECSTEEEKERDSPATSRIALLRMHTLHSPAVSMFPPFTRQLYITEMLYTGNRQSGYNQRRRHAINLNAHDNTTAIC